MQLCGLRGEQQIYIYKFQILAVLNCCVLNVQSDGITLLLAP